MALDGWMVESWWLSVESRSGRMVWKGIAMVPSMFAAQNLFIIDDRIYCILSTQDEKFPLDF